MGRVGARDFDDAYAQTLRTVRIALGFVLIASTAMYLNSQWVLGLFTDNPEIIAMFSMLSIMIGASYLLGLRLELGLIGIFIGLASDELIRGLLVFIRWLKGSWRGKEVVEAPGFE